MTVGFVEALVRVNETDGTAALNVSNTPSLLAPFRRCVGLSIRSVISVCIGSEQYLIVHSRKQLTSDLLYVILLDAGFDRFLDVPLLTDTDLVSMQMASVFQGQSDQLIYNNQLAKIVKNQHL